MWTTGSAVGVSLVCSAVAIARPPPRCGVGGTVDALGPGDDVPGDAAPEDAALGDAAGDGVPEYAVPEYAVPGRGRAGQLPGGRLLGDRLPGARRPGGRGTAGRQHPPPPPAGGPLGPPGGRNHGERDSALAKVHGRDLPASCADAVMLNLALRGWQDGTGKSPDRNVLSRRQGWGHNCSGGAVLPSRPQKSYQARSIRGGRVPCGQNGRF